MPVAKFQMPDGRIGRFEVPEGTSPEQAQSMIASSLGNQQPKKEMSWGEVGQQALMNAPSSLWNVGKSVAEAVSSPLETAKGVLDLGAGALQNILPESLVQAVGEDKESRQKASAVADFYKQRYGSMEGFKEALATDPAGVLADVSTVATGGGAAISKVPGLLKAGQAVSKVGSAVDPLAAALRGGAKTVELGGKGLGKVAAMASGVGSEPIEQAYKAGRAGGAQQASFIENMRGQVPVQDVLDTAKTDLQAMRQQQQAAYRSGMEDISKDASVLNFGDIDASLGKAVGRTEYKGQVVSEAAAKKVQEARQAVDQWKNLDPAQYHTPEGLDALKQKIGDILESIPFEQRNARAAIGDIYNSVKQTINSQAPSYAKVMKNYSDAAETMSEIERALSLGKKSSADTAIRKLQSLMRNNANTNYGQRLSLAKQLEQAGGKPIMPALAGQALSEWTPRGIQRGTALGTTGVSYLAGGIPYAIGSAAASSPRLVGETALKAGQLARGLRNVQGRAMAPLNAANIDPRILANALYQAGVNTEGQQ